MVNLFFIDSEVSARELHDYPNILISEIVSGLEPISVDETLILGGIIEDLVKKGIFCYFGSGNYTGDPMSAVSVEADRDRPSYSSISVSIGAEAIKLLPSGMLARFDQEASQTIDDLIDHTT